MTISMHLLNRYITDSLSRYEPMCTKNPLFFIILTLAFAACDDAVGPRYIEIIEVTVGPTLARCYGVGERDLHGG